MFYRRLLLSLLILLQSFVVPTHGAWQITERNYGLCLSADSAAAIYRGVTLSAGFSGWFKIPEVVPEKMTIKDETNGTDSSRLTWSITTDKRLELSGSPGSLNAGSVQTAVLGSGWHFVCGGNATEAAITFRVAPAVSPVADMSATTAYILPLVNCPTTARTRATWGRRWDGSERAEGVELLWWGLATSSVSGSEINAAYNNGVPINPEGLYNGPVSFIPFRSDLVPTFGTAEIGTQKKCTFTDDSALTGAAWTVPPIDAVPSVRNYDAFRDKGNCDYFVFSDSYGTINRADRLTMHLANELARRSGTAIKKFMHGYAESSVFGQWYDCSTTQPNKTIITFSNNYQWERNTLLTRLAMPMNAGVEIAVDVSNDTRPIMTVEYSNPGGSWTGPATWIHANDVLEVRPILRPTAGRVLEGFRLVDGTSTNPTDHTIAGSVNIPTGQVSKQLTVDVSGKRQVIFQPPTGTWSGSGVTAGDYFDFIGMVVDNITTERGVGVGFVADGSWQTSGWNVDATSSAIIEKQASDAQIEGAIAAFRDPDRHIVFVLSIALESGVAASVQQWIDRMDIRCSHLGIPEDAYSFVIVSQFAANYAGSDALALTRRTAEQSSVDMDEIAQDDSRVQHVSIYAATEGCLFHNSTVASFGANDALGTQQEFLERYDRSNGTTYASTLGRVTLDASDTHLGSFGAGQFMGEVLAKLLYARRLSVLAN